LWRVSDCEELVVVTHRRWCRCWKNITRHNFNLLL